MSIAMAIGYRYDPSFTRAKCEGRLPALGPRRDSLWLHALQQHHFDHRCLRSRRALAAEGALIHRMFDTRYYLMALVALSTGLHC